MGPVRPLHYNILFEPDFKTFKFRGEETVQVEFSEPTSSFVLNSADIEIVSCILSQKGKQIDTAVELDAKNEELKVKLKEKVSGKAELQIDFVGTHNDKLAGFYRSRYKVGGKEKFMVTTQFEAADARRAFPCWDEPEAKATFEISMLVDSKFEAISNMNVGSKKKSGDKTLYKFDRTPVMSTYLIYLGVGEFEHLQGKLGKVAIRIVTTKGKKEQGHVAMDMTKKFLGYYEDYFGIKYPLPKLDIIAVPDFAAGAMENWGAITFRETAVLFDEKNSSMATKHRIAEVIAHELAHQWFGNLVTMRWWNDLWLNESFATFMSYKAVNHFYPEWDFWDQFVSDSVSSGMSLDALKTSHPIDVDVKKPSDIRQIFDEISYEKGGSVLRMLEDFLTEEAFRSGLKEYLSDHKYGNATTDDLWSALAKSSGKPVKEMMDTWVRQVGYPMIEAKLADSKVSLTQKRFLLSGDGDSKQSWLIPLSVKTKSRIVSKLMDGKAEEIVLDDENEWFKVNFGGKGFYRVKYEKKSLDLLKGMIEKKELSNVDRWGITSDAFALCVARESSVSDFFDLVDAYKNEDDYLVLDDITSDLYSLYLITSQEKFWDKVTERNRAFFRQIFDRIGWDEKEGEKPTTKLLRGFVIAALGRFGDEEILQEAQRRFDDYLKKPDSLRPDLRGVVYGLVGWMGGEDVQEKMRQLYLAAPTQEEKIRFLSAYCSSQDEKLLMKALDYALSSEVRSQDMFVPAIRVGSNPNGRKLVWPWLKKNWTEVNQKLDGGLGASILKRMIESAGSHPDPKKADDMKAFFKKNPSPGIEMGLAQTLERIKIRSKFLDSIRKDLAE